MCLPVKPYKIEREWKHVGLTCAVVLNREAGNRCGYVRVPPGHPMFGKDYDSVDVDVHGGLTFAEIEPCKEHEDGQGWWFGFDCAHLGDARHDPNAKVDELVTEEGKTSLRLERQFSEMYKANRRHEHEHYWTQQEVVAETERLATQFAEAS